MLGRWIKRHSDDLGVVVFIHGFVSSGNDAWRHLNGCFWPTLLAGDQRLGRLAVYMFDYRTDFFSGTYSIADAAAALKEYFRLDGVLDFRQIVFVAHSMGGIVARKFLVDRQSDIIGRQRSIGLFLLASPSMGSQYANFFSALAKLVGHSQAEALRLAKANSWLDELDRQFVDLKESHRLSIYGKELIEDRFTLKPWPLGVLARLVRRPVVDQFSGARYFGEPFKVPSSDHLSIAKVDGEGAIQHRLLLDFVDPQASAAVGRLSSKRLFGTLSGQIPSAVVPRSQAILETERLSGRHYLATDGLIIHWRDGTGNGIDPTIVVDWKSRSKNGDKWAVDLPTSIQDAAKVYRRDVEEQFGPANRPKVWMKSLRSPLDDRSVAQIEVGPTDFWTSKAIEFALDRGDLLQSYNNGELDAMADTFGLIAVAAFVLTADDTLILSQRSRLNVDFAKDSYSPSYEEQWDPLRDTNPAKTVLRGLTEEFAMSTEFRSYPDQPVEINEASLKLHAIGREWGRFWNTCLIYGVRVAYSARQILDSWNRSDTPPIDRNEHQGVCAIPLTSESGVQFCRILMTTGVVNAESLKAICGRDRIAGNFTDGTLHPTCGRARIEIALRHDGRLI